MRRNACAGMNARPVPACSAPLPEPRRTRVAHPLCDLFTPLAYAWGIDDETTAMRRPDPEAGFTLVEVLAAGAVLSAVVLCAVRAWGVVDGLSLDLQLRQKAVFALNGEAERLTALYTVGGFNGSSGKSYGPSTLQSVSGSGYPALAGVTGSAARLAYAAATTGPGFLTTSASSFATSSSDSLVWVSGSGASTQDFVWLDRPRAVMARLSWVACPLSAAVNGSGVLAGNTAAVCWGSATTGTPSPLLRL